MALSFRPGLKLGILGGGQLARMLTLAAHRMGFEVHIFSESDNDPAAQVTSHHYCSAFNNTALDDFIKKMDLVTFESEFLDAKALSAINKKTNNIYPRPDLIGLLQDRKTQKALFDQHELPTATWLNLETTKELLHVLDHFDQPIVLKQRRFGYDGYGTFVAKEKSQARQLMEKFRQNPPSSTFIAEQWIPFKRELACIFARNQKGEVVHYPLVESQQVQSRCFWTRGPVGHKKFPPLAKKISKFLNSIDYIGVMGFEFFETKWGLLINEIAPRVHNTGHYTMDAFSIDQFELHLRAICGFALQIPSSPHGGFAMVNLLGDSQQSPSWKFSDGSSLHWYGKQQNRPGRKMGHINAVGSNSKKALKKALKAREKVQL